MPWRVAIGKELRALFPAWMAVCAAAIASQFAHLGLVIWGIYIIGAAALGAVSIGHEYLHGTLSPWLALPVSRQWLLLAKLTALAPLLFSLAALVVFLAVAFPQTSWILVLGTDVWPVVGWPLVYALFVAPWLTMVARGPLGGLVFTLAVPTVFGLAFAMLHALQLWKRAPLETALALFAVTGAVLGWRTFMRLEAIDTHRHVNLPTFLGVRSASRMPSVSHPLWALLTKELRLQQLTFVVAGLSFATVLVARWLRNLPPDSAIDLVFPLSVLHLGLVPILAGALASAEERRLGTLEWQVLQPMATWQQWALKVGVAIGLGLLLAVGPLVLLSVADPASAVVTVQRPPLVGQAVSAVIALTLTALYVSSVSPNGIRAAILSLAVLALLAVVGQPLARLGASFLQLRLEPLIRGMLPNGYSYSTYQLLGAVTGWLMDAFTVGLAFVVLRFALVNHRSAERGARRVLPQGVALAAYVLCALFVVGSVAAVRSAGISSGLTPGLRQAVSASMTRRARWQHELDVLTKGFDGRVGVCAGDGLLEACVRDNQLFPMQSVMKLPVAVSALEKVDDGKWSLDDEIVVHKQDLSVFVQPMAKLVGPNGFKTTIGDLVRRTIVDSDSAATDILIAKLGGTGAVQLTLNRKATTAVRVDRDEKHLQTEINGLDWRDEYLDPPTLDRAINAVPEAQRDAAFQAYLHDRRDTSTPRGMTILLDKLAAGRLLSASSTQFLLDTLKQTTTFPDRLKAGVPDGWTIGHKTGTSGSWRGVTAAFNDVGILTGPKGETISIAVFITESKASDKDLAKLMADIARAIATKY